MAHPAKRDLADEFHAWLSAHASELAARGFDLRMPSEDERAAFRKRLEPDEIGTTANGVGSEYRIGRECGSIHVWGDGTAAVTFAPPPPEVLESASYFRLHGNAALFELVAALFAELEAWSKGAPRTDRFVTDGERDLWPGMI